MNFIPTIGINNLVLATCFSMLLITLYYVSYIVQDCNIMLN